MQRQEGLIWAVCRGFGQFAGGSLQGAGGSGLGSLQGAGGSGLGSLQGQFAGGRRQRFGQFAGESPLGGLSRSSGGRGQGQQLWGQGARLRHLRSPSAALGAGGAASASPVSVSSFTSSCRSPPPP